jgi:hypothetical protein
MPRLRCLLAAGLPVAVLAIACSADSSTETPSESGDPGSPGDVVPFEVSPAEISPSMPPESPWRGVTVELESVPSAVAAGDVLSFVVAITNNSESELDLSEECPSYFMNFGESSETVVPIMSLLNCSSAAPIGVGETERFAMDIEIPANMQLGAGTIYWRLEPSIAADSSSEIRVEG